MAFPRFAGDFRRLLSQHAGHQSRDVYRRLRPEIVSNAGAEAVGERGLVKRVNSRAARTRLERVASVPTSEQVALVVDRELILYCRYRARRARSGDP